MKKILVDPNGKGDFTGLQAALDGLDPRDDDGVEIELAPGIYREKVFVRPPNVAIRGAGPGETVIRWNDAARKNLPDGRPMGTFHSYTLLALGDGFSASGLTIENDAGPGDEVGQAIAAYVEADRAVFDHCRLLGRQDTLFTGPLPPRAIQPNGFFGPLEHETRRQGRQIYRDCEIRGDVDFIFGSAAALFHRCHVVSLDRGPGGESWITAASTPEGARFGYLFVDCDLAGPAAPGTVWLGRPWRDFAKTVFFSCRMGTHIKAEGWHDWNKPKARRSAFYAEHACSGPGADAAGRAAWSRRLAREEADQWTEAAFLDFFRSDAPLIGYPPG